MNYKDKQFILDYVEKVKLTRKEMNHHLFSTKNDLSEAEMEYLRLKMSLNDWKRPDQMTFPNGDTKELIWEGML